MNTKYIPTGNEYLSLPTIREADCAIESINFLNMSAKGMIEVVGSDTRPFILPCVIIGGVKRKITDFVWQRQNYWIPTFTAKVEGFELSGIILAPVNERGFCLKFTLSGSCEPNTVIDLGVEGCWRRTLHTVNESKEILSNKNYYKSGWNYGYVFDMRTPLPLFAFAPMFDGEVVQSVQRSGEEVNFSFIKETIAKDKFFSFSFLMYLGVAFEEVAAATSAKEMYRQSFDILLAQTNKFLAERTLTVKDAKLDRLMNTNLFFSMFFSTGLTLDSEERVLVTSRSPRYYVSSAYWDRDSMLWSFPAILLSDVTLAKEMLTYVFTKQIRNVGIHSRFIDGTVLEPGFELDELCAPVIALSEYFKKTRDEKFIKKPFIVDGIKLILDRLQSKKHPTISLYESWLQPTDDTRVYPYITYDNVLVHVMLSEIARMYGDEFGEDFANKLLTEAEQVRQAIQSYCVQEVNGKRVYIWSTDCNGKWDIYDEPPGSLQLLSYYGFCNADDEVYLNTLELIRRKEYPYSFYGCPIAEIGCPHAPHPWVLSIANSLLCGKAVEAKEHLYLCSMDNYIACESVDEYTGVSCTGDAFATCAGFLAYSIYKAFH